MTTDQAFADATKRPRDAQGAPTSIRVLFLGPILGVGGEEISTLSLAQCLVRMGHQVGYASEGGPLVDDAWRLGVGIHLLPLNTARLPGIWRASRELRRTLIKRPYDILHAQQVFTTLIADLARKFPVHLGARLVFHYRGIRPKMMPLASRLIPRLADFVITNAEVNREALLRHGADGRKIRTIYNGFDWGPFDQPQDRAALRRDWNVPHDAPMAGVIGRLQPVKGHRYFLHAAARVIERLPQARFVIVGDGPLRGELETRARDLGLSGCVRFLGIRRDIPAVLAALDLLVLPSLEEPFGRVLVEAGAAGLPVVCTRVGGTVEVVVDGVTGYFVPPAAVDPLADRISELLSDPARGRSMGAAGRERVQSRFGLDTMTNETLEVYRRLLSTRST